MNRIKKLKKKIKKLKRELRVEQSLGNFICPETGYKCQQGCYSSHGGSAGDDCYHLFKKMKML